MPLRHHLQYNTVQKFKTFTIYRAEKKLKTYIIVRIELSINENTERSEI